ncbi:hypothetical protein THIOM_002246 [Candidatus Thiomargarita nelsonii]|uniref:Uncharacterized protein n=1 Tax=Candidatus Thiomargarita nelsonii TaxID=1003181 RepID=A0A0A6RJ93_9GAMM|nr:hypothetical protein THIOM_002246 [Candidatus Thiomargarita nelsonii]
MKRHVKFYQKLALAVVLGLIFYSSKFFGVHEPNPPETEPQPKAISHSQHRSFTQVISTEKDDGRDTNRQPPIVNHTIPNLTTTTRQSFTSEGPKYLELLRLLSDNGSELDQVGWDEAFDDFLTDKTVPRADKLDMLRQLLTQFHPGVPAYAYLLDQLEDAAPFELTESLMAEYEYALEPEVKLRLLEVMRESIPDAQNEAYEEDEEMYEGDMNQEEILAIINDQKQWLHDLLSIENGEIYESEYIYEEHLVSYAAVATPPEVISMMNRAILGDYDNISRSSMIDVAISFTLDEQQSTPFDLLLEKAREFPADIQQEFYNRLDIFLEQSTPG